VETQPQTSSLLLRNPPPPPPVMILHHLAAHNLRQLGQKPRVQLIINILPTTTTITTTVPGFLLLLLLLLLLPRNHGRQTSLQQPRLGILLALTLTLTGTAKEGSDPATPAAFGGRVSLPGAVDDPVLARGLREAGLGCSASCCCCGGSSGGGAALLFLPAAVRGENFGLHFLGEGVEDFGVDVGGDVVVVICEGGAVGAGFERGRGGFAGGDGGGWWVFGCFGLVYEFAADVLREFG
jgi:hypothetical protein